MSGSTKGTFSVTIAATDAATATIDKINKRLAEIRRPTEQMNRSLQRFSEVSGLKSIAKDLDGVQRYALQGVFALERMAPGMAAIAGAATVGGITALSKSFADLNVALSNTSNRLGVAPAFLAAFQGAARQARADVSGVTSSFEALGDALSRVRTGQDTTGFSGVMAALHVSMTKADGTLKSAAELMPEINDSIARIQDPALRAQAERDVYGNEAMDPIIREGSAAFRRQMEDAEKRLQVTNDSVAAQTKLADQLTLLQQSFEGLATKITTDVAPALGHVADWMSNFVTNNPGVVEEIALLGVGFTTLAGTIGLVTKAAGLMPAWLIPMLARAAPILLTGPAGEVDPRSRFDQTGQPRTPTGPDPFTGLLPGAEPPLPSTWGRGFHAADLWRRYSPTTDPRLDPSSFPPNYDPSADRGDRPRLQFLRDQWTAKGDVPGGPKDADSKRATSTPAELIRAEQQGREIGRAISDWLTSHAEELARAIGGGAVRGITFTAPTTAPGVPTTAPSAPTPASGDDRPGAPEPWNVPGAEMPPQLGPKDLETVTTPGGAAWRMNRDHADYFRRFFSELEKLEGHPLVSSGGYNWRPVRGGSSPSAHAYGEAGDVDAPHNPQGNSGQTNLPPEPALRALLRRYPHIRWGGDFP